MFERLPQTKKALHKAKPPLKKFVNSSIALNKPLLEKRFSTTRKTEMLHAIKSLLDEKHVKLPEDLPESIVRLGIEVAKAWDSSSVEEREAAGLPEPFCNKTSSESILFSQHRGRAESMGQIAERTEAKAEVLSGLKLILALRSGLIPLEKVQEHFVNSSNPIKVDSIKEENGVVVLHGSRAPDSQSELSSSRVKLFHPKIEKRIHDCEKKLSLFRYSIAARLTIGYSPVL